jgi:hypothetical protein
MVFLLVLTVSGPLLVDLTLLTFASYVSTNRDVLGLVARAMVISCGRWCGSCVRTPNLFYAVWTTISRQPYASPSGFSYKICSHKFALLFVQVWDDSAAIWLTLTDWGVPDWGVLCSDIYIGILKYVLVGADWGVYSPQWSILVRLVVVGPLLRDIYKTLGVG